MLKTNSKIYVNSIQNYLLNSIEFDGMENVELSNRQKIEYFFNEFENHANYKYNLQRFPNIQERLKNWLQGLPSCINIVFSNYDILQLAKNLHNVESFTEKQEDTIVQNYFNHVAFHLLKLKNKYTK
jgi:hypothetical protein